MTLKKRLAPVAEVTAYLDLLAARGHKFNVIDIRSDGLTLSNLPSPPARLGSPPAGSEPARSENAFDAWQASSRKAAQD